MCDLFLKDYLSFFQEHTLQVSVLLKTFGKYSKITQSGLYCTPKKCMQIFVKNLSIPRYEDHRERLGTYGIWDLVGGLGDGGRCAMWVKNRDYRLRRRRRRRRRRRIRRRRRGRCEHVPHQDHSKIFPASTRLGVQSTSFGGADEKPGFI